MKKRLAIISFAFIFLLSVSVVSAGFWTGDALKTSESGDLPTRVGGDINLGGGTFRVEEIRGGEVTLKTPDGGQISVEQGGIIITPNGDSYQVNISRVGIFSRRGVVITPVIPPVNGSGGNISSSCFDDCITQNFNWNSCIASYSIQECQQKLDAVKKSCHSKCKGGVSLTSTDLVREGAIEAIWNDVRYTCIPVFSDGGDSSEKAECCNTSGVCNEAPECEGNAGLDCIVDGGGDGKCVE